MPLYENLPLAAQNDPALYELLALFDALRVGRARERKLAMDELHMRLGAATGREENVMMSNNDTLVIGRTIVIPRDALRDLARRYKIRRLALFGSAARDELRPESDIDLLVESEPGHAPSLWKTQELQEDFSRLFGRRPVDIAPPEILRNPYRRRTIGPDLRVLYEAA